MSEGYENCPNCGAPKKGFVCEYCGTHFSWRNGKMVVDVEPGFVDIYDWGRDLVQRIPLHQNVTVNIVSGSPIGITEAAGVTGCTGAASDIGCTGTTGMPVLDLLRRNDGGVYYQ